jgi:hypothetical protein
LKLKNNRLYDPVRKTYVLPLPEEIVRQQLIHKMINLLGFPMSLLAIEKDLCNLPHLQNKEFPSQKRRADIICFAKNINPNYSIYPLLMIECKACKLTKKTIDQVLGYNHFVESYFVSIANETEIITFWYDLKNGKYTSINFLPSYEQLIQAISYERNR